MKTYKFDRIVKALSIIALTTFVCSCHKTNRAPQEGPMNVDVAMPKVDSVMVRKSYPGFLSARNTVDLVARVDGELRSRNYQPGQLVKKGAVLFIIDSTTYQNEVDQAKANLDNAKASYEYYSKQYEAMEIALKSDAVSRMEVLQAKSNMDEALAQIRNYEAALNTARKTLSYCTVTAPFDGRVTVSNYDPGNFLPGAASPVTLATLYDDASVYATIDIDNDTYLKLMKNESQNLDLSSIPVSFSEPLNHQYTADLTYMAPDVDRSTGTIRLRGIIQNPYGELKSGMFVNVELPIENRKNAILIQDAAIGTDQLGKYVYVVNDSNQIIYTPVEIGELVDGTQRIVNAGLEPDMPYVTKALLKVRNGEKVNPIRK